MKALVIITGRGLGGDAVIANNIIEGLEAKGIQCEIALDESAPGLLFKKKGRTWHKIKIPQAGGHAATKATAIKAAFKMISATFKARRLIKKLNADFVVGVIGGGAIVGSVGAKLARKPAVSIVATPLDSKICPKFNQSFALPEMSYLLPENLPKNLDKTLYPLKEGVGDGNPNVALEKLKESSKFDENKKTILFSSGSSIFKGIIEGANNFSKITDDYNILLVGLPLKEDYLDELDENVIYLGYIDWMNHLLTYLDLAVLTDDGVLLEETLASELPIVTVTKVKWGRYHNMAGVFKGAIIESDIDNLNDNIFKAFDEFDELKKNAIKYSKDSLEAKSKLAQRIIDVVK
ncbi:glycosyltransferase [uncultured Methanobrevibacter sp.]|uniref:glycosyltransferase n=1 Tax=uncultured Methanobrevibacter sp. TaxID=253161 RepID=UPI00260735CB|nr:glycosyltransferase [uncultured Methanobrevibacter sp.]